MSQRQQLVALGAGVAVVALALAIVALVHGGRQRTTSTVAVQATTTAPAPVSPGPAHTSTSLAAAPVTPGPPRQPPPTAQAFGVNVNLLFNGGTYSQTQINSQLQAVRATGATVARSDAFWESAEPSAPVHGVHHYDWQFDDEVAGSLAQDGLRWMPILDYTAPWAQSIAGQDHSPPSSPADYAAYAAAFAARYGPAGSFWHAHPSLTPEPVQTFEIWNEPDNAQFWTPAPNAAAYAELYEQARDAILAADPTGRVLIGGLTSPGTFLPAMLAADPELRGHIDGIAIHPYGDPLVLLSKVRAARAAITSLRLGPVPLYVTEFGWTTRPRGTVDYAPESARPGYLVATLGALGHLDCGVAAALLYTWVSPESDPANGQDWYGISNPHGGSTPDVVAFTAGLKAAAAPRSTIRLCG
ncbi:MAG: hypothetical protein ACLPTJ_11990 [Solirubrobacteraceae bacterium]